jgi:DNA-binding NtrC family response regulator
MVAEGSFRADLYYRLNVLPIRPPPLRERLGDLEALVEALAEDIARRSGLPHKGLNADALDLLGQHDWPGNIRELRNVLEQATLMTDDPMLGVAHFQGLLPGRAPAAPPRDSAPAQVPAGPTFKPMPQAVAELEAALIAQALQRTGGNKLAAARLLGISRATLYQKLPAQNAPAPNGHTQTTQHGD